MKSKETPESLAQHIAQLADDASAPPERKYAVLCLLSRLVSVLVERDCEDVLKELQRVVAGTSVAEAEAEL